VGRAALIPPVRLESAPPAGLVALNARSLAKLKTVRAQAALAAYMAAPW